MKPNRINEIQYNNSFCDVREDMQVFPQCISSVSFPCIHVGAIYYKVSP